MPARQIKKSYRNVTGFVSTDKVDRLTAYEWPLERDCQELVVFNKNVKTYEEQPITIEYFGPDLKPRKYTPDILIYFHIPLTKPLLAEIKTRKELLQKWTELRPKFVAGRKHAEERNFDFTIITDLEIRTPYLKNAVFLRDFLINPVNEDHTHLLIEVLKDLGETSPKELLQKLTIDLNEQALLIPSLWRLVADHRIDVDLTKPLTMLSRISLFTKPEGSKLCEGIFQLRAGSARFRRYQALRYFPHLEP